MAELKGGSTVAGNQITHAGNLESQLDSVGKIGSKSSLTTNEKETIVGAINEINNNKASLEYLKTFGIDETAKIITDANLALNSGFYATIVGEGVSNFPSALTNDRYNLIVINSTANNDAISQIAVNRHSNKLYIRNRYSNVWSSWIEALQLGFDGNLKVSGELEDGFGNKLSSLKSLNITVSIGTDWVGSVAPFTQTLSISELLSSDNPIVSPVLSETISTALSQQESYNKISRATTSNGAITFTCYEEKPTVSIPIQIKVVR